MGTDHQALPVFFCIFVSGSPVSTLTVTETCPLPTQMYLNIYDGRTESHEQLFFACELGTAGEGECGDRWNQLLCYP